MSQTADVAVIGGGIVGTATAMALTRAGTTRVTVLEAEDRLAAHQTGNNSGVIHSGIYYKPGSAKARNCTDGRELLYQFCAENGVPHERCGKLIVATTTDELPALEEISRRGQANGLSGLRPLRAEELREYEPHVRGVAGLHVPDTGIVDFTAVTLAYARKVREAGGQVRTGARLLAVRRDGSEIVLETAAGEVRARHLVNCAGLQSDRVARLCGTDPGVQIVPFRGEYYELTPGRTHLVRNLIYPVPDPRLPFLRMGGFVGPGLRKNAVHDILTGGPLWLDPASELQFLPTDDLARTVLRMVDDGVSNDTFNVCGRGVIRLSEVVRLVGRDVPVKPGAPTVRYEVGLDKVSRHVTLPDTRASVTAFVQDQLAAGRVAGAA